MKRSSLQYTLGINPCIDGLNYHDPSVCLVCDGEIIFAIEEERLNRIKHSIGVFPKLSVEECKKIALKNNAEISCIAIGYDPQLNLNRKLINEKLISDYKIVLPFKIKSLCNLPNAEVKFYNHHKCHVASSFYCSNFHEALCVVFDGVGELATTSAWLCNNKGIKKIDEILMPNSLGYFYALATAFVGFSPWDQEGKLMALSPYGKENLNIQRFLNQFLRNDSFDFSDIFNECLIEGYKLDIKKGIEILSLLLEHKPRKKNDLIIDWYKDFAYEVQKFTQEIVLKYIKCWLKRYNVKNICFAGGLFLNCKMNGFLRESLKNTNLFFQPIAGDNGTSIGAAILRDREFNKESVKYDLKKLSLGLSFDDKQIEIALNKSNLSYKKPVEFHKYVAQKINEKKIVAWFEGANEMGCRALGHRSILAYPKAKDMADTINKRIKHREVWRPFACSLLEDFAEMVLTNYSSDQLAAYMIEAYYINGNWLDEMQAVIHSGDSTTRPQVVRNDKINASYYKLIHEFYKISNLPFILNTSLNDRGQPIITTPEEAVNFFINNDIDMLAIQGFIIEKEENVKTN